MPYKMTTEAVRIAAFDLLNTLDYWPTDGEEAKTDLAYIAGALDMAHAVIKLIETHGGLSE